MSAEVRDLVVVGAGAAGAWCAWRAAALGVGDVLLLEKTPRVGTKVLASGGSRCNLTTTLGPDGAGRLFGDRAARFLRRALRTLPPAEVRARFAELGVPTEEAPLEKVFPTSGRAKDVRDALARALEASGVELRTRAGVLALEALAPPAAGDPAAPRWRLDTQAGPLEARRLVLAAGGLSYPSTGTTGDAYPWLAALGLELVPPRPALVPVTSPAAWVHDLTGLAVQHAEARLVDGAGKLLGRRRRPVLFTHRGLSGPAAMDLSRHVSEALARGADLAGWRLLVDLVPDLDREELRALLVDLTGRPGRPLLVRALGEALHAHLAQHGADPLPRRLLEAVLAVAGIDPGADHQALDRASRHALVETLRGLPVPVDGTLGWDQAEVTAGGLALAEVDPGTCRVRARAGLWAIGELLDLDGPIGGLNFQAAFATAEVAALDLARGE